MIQRVTMLMIMMWEDEGYGGKPNAEAIFVKDENEARRIFDNRLRSYEFVLPLQILITDSAEQLPFQEWEKEFRDKEDKENKIREERNARAEYEKLKRRFEGK